MEAAAASTEITVLGWSIVLLLLHIVAQTLAFTKDVGVTYALSNRDGSRIAGPVAQRLLRGLGNYVETFAAFAALALALAVTGKTGGIAAAGALIWFWARVAYVPVFAVGIPVLRTAVWTISIIGLVMMLVRLMS